MKTTTRSVTQHYNLTIMNRNNTTYIFEYVKQHKHILMYERRFQECGVTPQIDNYVAQQLNLDIWVGTYQNNHVLMHENHHQECDATLQLDYYESQHNLSIWVRT